MSEIEEKLRKLVVQELGLAAEQEDAVKPEASFTDDLGADSLDMAELVLEVEGEFGVDISDDEIEKVMTFGDLITLVGGKIA